MDLVRVKGFKLTGDVPTIKTICAELATLNDALASKVEDANVVTAIQAEFDGVVADLTETKDDVDARTADGATLGKRKSRWRPSCPRLLRILRQKKRL